ARRGARARRRALRRRAARRARRPAGPAARGGRAAPPPMPPRRSSPCGRGRGRVPRRRWRGTAPLPPPGGRPRQRLAPIRSELPARRTAKRGPSIAARARSTPRASGAYSARARARPRAGPTPARALGGQLRPRAGLEVVPGSLRGGVLGEGLGERSEAVRGGDGIALRQKARVLCDGGRVAGVVGQGLGEELLLLDRIGDQRGGGDLEVGALARLAGAGGACPQRVGEIGSALLLGERSAHRPQGGVGPGVLARGAPLGQSRP